MNYIENLNCSICNNIYCNPVSLYCGHSFCRNCLILKYNYQCKCPKCNEIIHIIPSLSPTSQLLESIIQSAYPIKYKERLEEAKEFTYANNIIYIPLFVLTAGDFPGRNFPMHIFEERYRLMMKRLLKGSRIFGLVGHNNGEILDIGVTLKIFNSEIYPDGRSNINTIITKRFKILNTWNMDGYTIGKVEIFYDNPLQNDEINYCKELYIELENKLNRYVQRERRTQSININNYLTNRPDINIDTIHIDNNENIIKYSFWLSSFIPITSNLRQQLLSTKSTIKRLEILNELFSQALLLGLTTTILPAAV